MYFLPFNEAQGAEFLELCCENKADLSVECLSVFAYSMKTQTHSNKQLTGFISETHYIFSCFFFSFVALGIKEI